MTATPGTKPAPKPPAEIPPFAIYRATTAHWEDGSIKMLYVRLKGQGARTLIEEHPGEECIELGDKYQLTLVRIEEGEPVPPIEMPEFPVLPEPPIAELPVKPEQPIYKPEKPVKPVPPIYEKPEYPTRPITPEQPIYIEPGPEPK